MADCRYSVSPVYDGDAVRRPPGCGGECEFQGLEALGFSAGIDMSVYDSGEEVLEFSGWYREP